MNAEEQKTIQDRLGYLSVRKRLSLQGCDGWRIASPPWISVAQLTRPPSAAADMAAVSSQLGRYNAASSPPRQAELGAMTDAVCQVASLKRSEKREDESAAQLLKGSLNQFT